MKVYVVIYVGDYVPSVRVYHDRERALQEAKDYAGNWDNEHNISDGELYFNQEDDGNMENAVSVFEAEVVEQ